MTHNTHRPGHTGPMQLHILLSEQLLPGLQAASCTAGGGQCWPVHERAWHTLDGALMLVSLQTPDQRIACYNPII
eukprot:1071812-Pelagomonas_calceolata.AAC.2